MSNYNRKKTFCFKCKNCGKVKIGYVGQKFCSIQCRNINYGIKSYNSKISPGTIGAIQELKVGIDLLEKGFAVFRSISPSCFCDLIAIKDNNVFDIEVKTAYQNKNGSILHPKKNIRAKYLALVVGTTITYKPDFVR